MPGSTAHQLARCSILSRSILYHQRRQHAEIARLCLAHPAHDRVRIAVEARQQMLEETRPREAPVVRPQYAPRRLAADPRAAALVGHREAPATDAMLAPGDAAPADAARADDDDAAVAASVRTDARGVCVSGDERVRERQVVCARRRKAGGLAGPGQRQAGDDIDVAERQARLLQARIGGAHDRRKALLEAKANVGRAGRAFAPNLTIEIGKTGAAAGSAAIDTKK